MKRSSEIILLAAILVAGFVLPHFLDGDSRPLPTRVAGPTASAASLP